MNLLPDLDKAKENAVFKSQPFSKAKQESQANNTTNISAKKDQSESKIITSVVEPKGGLEAIFDDYGQAEVNSNDKQDYP